MARLGLVVLADGRQNQHQRVLRHNPKQQNLLHYAFQPLGQRFFYDQTFPPNPYSFGVKDGVAAQLLLFATRAAQKPRPPLHGAYTRCSPPARLRWCDGALAALWFQAIKVSL